MRILVANRQPKKPLNRQMRKIINAVIEEAGRQFALPDNTEVSVTIMDNAGITELNRAYRGIDRPTDVLSFAFDEQAPDGGVNLVSPGDTHLLGDIIISLEQASVQAEEYGHALDREVGYLTVHGMLHLLGFDHKTEEDTLKMRNWEEKILSSLDLARQ